MGGCAWEDQPCWIFRPPPWRSRAKITEAEKPQTVWGLVSRNHEIGISPRSIALFSGASPFPAMSSLAFALSLWAPWQRQPCTDGDRGMKWGKTNCPGAGWSPGLGANPSDSSPAPCAWENTACKREPEVTWKLPSVIHKQCLWMTIQGSGQAKQWVRPEGLRGCVNRLPRRRFKKQTLRPHLQECREYTG